MGSKLIIIYPVFITQGSVGKIRMLIGSGKGERGEKGVKMGKLNDERKTSNFDIRIIIVLTLYL